MKFNKKTGIWLGLSLMALFACLTAGCGYQLRGRASFWPPGMKRIYLPVFKNSTGRFQLEAKITEKVINELVARTGVVIVGDQDTADGMIQGEILSFKVDPIMVAEGGTASKYKITVVASVSFTDFLNQTILFHDDNFTFVEEYEVPAGSDFETEETKAIDRVAEKFARQLVINLVEGF